MKLDNQTIMMVVVAIVLGMLVANMVKEVCGCKNLIEGQTLQNGCITTPLPAAATWIPKDSQNLTESDVVVCEDWTIPDTTQGFEFAASGASSSPYCDLCAGTNPPSPCDTCCHLSGR